ncbi:MAG: hypothetical protein PHQ05_08560 [Sterolibacterium sp.]|nr:hypothetical protein [Sterolibacterium sp.]
MKTRSVCLPPGRLLPGMTTAAAILTRQGEELLPANRALDEAMIESIRRRLIKSVIVMLPDDRDMASIDREIATEEKRLAYIFRGDSNEARADLHRLVAAYRRNQVA